MIGDPYLTGTSRSHRDTVAGMAHFAGTGPVGSHCTDTKYTRGCRFYDKERCIKYRELTNEVGAKIAGNPPACKYYEEYPKDSKVTRA